MSYEARGLFDSVRAELLARPRATLAEVSRGLAVDRRTLEKAVKHVSGKIFRELRQEVLLACFRDALLRSPSAPLKQVAFALGFSSLRSLDRFVKTATGMSPTALRELIPRGANPGRVPKMYKGVQ